MSDNTRPFRSGVLHITIDPTMLRPDTTVKIFWRDPSLTALYYSVVSVNFDDGLVTLKFGQEDLVMAYFDEIQKIEVVVQD